MFTDNEVPTVNCVEGQSSEAEEGKATAMVIWEDPITLDNSGNVSVSCDPPSGTDFPIGKKPITCEAVDGSGNRAECSFIVTVIGNHTLHVHYPNAAANLNQPDTQSTQK